MAYEEAFAHYSTLGEVRDMAKNYAGIKYHQVDTLCESSGNGVFFCGLENVWALPDDFPCRYVFKTKDEYVRLVSSNSVLAPYCYNGRSKKKTSYLVVLFDHDEVGMYHSTMIEAQNRRNRELRSGGRMGID